MAKCFGFVVFAFEGVSESEFLQNSKQTKRNTHKIASQTYSLFRRLLLFASNEVVYYYTKLIHFTCLCVFLYFLGEVVSLNTHVITQSIFLCAFFSPLSLFTQLSKCSCVQFAVTVCFNKEMSKSQSN